MKNYENDNFKLLLHLIHDSTGPGVHVIITTILSQIIFNFPFSLQG